jgi:signal transduction histidine kinase
MESVLHMAHVNPCGDFSFFWRRKKIKGYNAKGMSHPYIPRKKNIAAAKRSTRNRTVTRRAIARHTFAQDREFIWKLLDHIEKQFGQEAAQAALKFAEKFTELHIKKSVHDIKNVLTHFGLDINAILPCIKEPAIRSRLKRFENGYQDLEQLVMMMEAYAEDLNLVLQYEAVAEIVKRACASAIDQVRKQGRNTEVIKFNLSIPGDLRAPVSIFHFEMALTNLIKNGIEAHAVAPRELWPGTIFIKAIMEGNWLTLTVRDTGKGIAPGDLAKLREFIPGVSAKRQAGSGSGYGLPICRRYIEAHGGTFSIESKEDVGTTAIIRLPAMVQQQTGL